MLEELVNGHARAAALRYTYLLDALTPAPTSPGKPPAPYETLSRDERDAVFAHLTGRGEVVGDAGRDIRWMLRDGERREALRGLLDSGTTADAVAAARRDAAAEAKQAADARKAVAPSEDAPTEDSPPSQALVADEERSAATMLEETLWCYLTGQPPPGGKTIRAWPSLKPTTTASGGIVEVPVPARLLRRPHDQLKLAGVTGDGQTREVITYGDKRRVGCPVNSLNTSRRRG